MTTADYVLDERYALIERLATGGMGEVWRGADQILGRPVAIKMLAAAHADDAQFRARFRAEARYASSLAHPGITRVFDYGEHSPLGGPYLVMELVDGQPLSEIIERYGRLDPYVVLDIVAQAARAMDAAHRAGIVHRDIKPGNLLIMADGTTKITDFGIAKANQPDVNLTATGIVMGTALYVSPEQATGQPLTGSSDIYSLGVVAYECLAGDPPFVSDQAIAIAIMHKHDQVPPLPDDVPRPIANLVYAMLAKEPRDRPQTARHVAERADVVREARFRTGNSGPMTSDLPSVPNFPPATSLDLYQGSPERLPAPRTTGNKSFLLAGIGAAGIGVVAIIAVLISSNSNQTLNSVGGNTTLPTQTQSGPTTHKGGPAAKQPVSAIGGVNPGTGVVVGATGTTAASKTPGASKSPAKSPTPTKSATPTPTPTPTATTPTPTPTPTRTRTTKPPSSSPPPSSPPPSSPPPSSPPPVTSTTIPAA
jgi:eukaryotic-like serine/threonine-protein kinase